MNTIRTLTLLIGIYLGGLAFADQVSVTWKLFSDDFYIYSGGGYAFVNDTLFTFGNYYFPNNFRFNFTDGSLVQYPNFTVPFAVAPDSPCVVPVPNGDIYIIGASPPWSIQNPNPLYDVYKLSAGAKNYTKMARLNIGRIQHTCAYDADTNRIYTFSGISVGTHNNTPYYYYPNAGEYYSIDDNTWTFVAERPIVCYNCSTINTNDGHIYTFNGEKDHYSSIYRYTIVNDSWTDLGLSNKPNWGRVVALDEEMNIILSFGGLNDQNDGCEYFNLTSLTAMPFICRQSDNTVITGPSFLSFFGSFIPATRTMYALNVETLHLWTTTFPGPELLSPITEPVSMPVPITQTPMMVPMPVSQTPVLNDTPVTSPVTSPPPPSGMVSEAVIISSELAIGLTSAWLILVTLVL